MAFILNAACFCNTGKVRKNNEDNYFFDGRCLPETNEGLKLPVSMTHTLRKEYCVAVFDGMGGENFGEAASFAAADGMQSITRRLKDYFFPERRFLKNMCTKLNDLVLARANELDNSVQLASFLHNPSRRAGQKRCSPQKPRKNLGFLHVRGSKKCNVFP